MSCVSYNDWLQRHRLTIADRIAIVDDADGRQYTYAELDDRARRLAGLLQEDLEIGCGDRVACLSTNRVEYLELYFATAMLGAILVPLNFRLPLAGIAELLKDCGPKLFVHESAYARIAEAALQEGLVRRIVSIEGTPGSPSLRSLSAGSGENRAAQPGHAADQNDVVMILYTSGTTGKAKGAMITWRQIHWNALNTTIGLQLTRDDAALLNTPLYHTGGWHVLFSPLMLLGGRVILQTRFDAERCNERIGPAGVTILFGVPTMMRLMCEAENFAAADFSRVRFAICGGEPCPIPVIEAYQRRGVAVRQGYGLTEAGPNCFSLPAADAVRKQGSIGFPNFFVETRLVRDDGREAAVDEVGELWMRGPHLFAGYWQNEAETAKTLRDGWIATGDLMTRDEQGYHYVVGRKKEMYISGGENVYPAQIERVLQSHEAVALAAVIGVPDPNWGEAGCAFVQPHPGHALTYDEVIAWCRRHLAGYQCPSQVVMLEQLPVGHSGKIDKLALRKLV